MSPRREVKTLQPMKLTLPPAPVSISMSDIPLPKDYQEPLWAKDILEEWKRANDLEKAGAYPTQSVLLRGPSGTGKSTSARWLSKSLSLPLFVMSIASTIESYMGSTSRNVDAAFKYARENRCLLLLDEVDSIAASRQAKHNDVGEIWRITNSFIQSLDEWHSVPRKSLLVATTNVMDGSIDHAISRRFEVQQIVPMPTSVELSKIAGIPWPPEFIVSQAECARMSLLARRQSVMRSMSYEVCLMSLIASESAVEEIAF